MLLIPQISGIIKTNKHSEELLNAALNTFSSSINIVLKNDTLSENNKFTLIRRNQVLKIFNREFIMNEIRCEVIHDEIYYECRMTDFMKVIFWIDTFILIVISLLFIANSGHGSILVFLVFISIMIFIIYYWLNNELQNLENEFLEIVKYI